MKKRVRISWMVLPALIFISTFFPRSFASAQTVSDQAVITWHAGESYVPPSYPGKALPNVRSTIVASVEIFSESSGSMVNLNNQTIYWYLDNTLIGGGPGTQSITFSPFAGDSGAETLKVELPDYSQGSLVQVVNIPVMNPVVTISPISKDGTFSESPVMLQANPYFFNVASVNSLSFSWTINSEPVLSQENPSTLEINIPAGSRAGSNTAVAVTVANSIDNTSASGQTNLVYQPLP